MRCLTLILLVSFLPIKGIADELWFPVTWEMLMDAMKEKESSHNRWAYNRYEKAHGILQIRNIYLRDFNNGYGKKHGKRYEPRDLYDPKKAEEVVYGYSKMWCKKRGVRWTAKNIAMFHNGGPRGIWKRRARMYWNGIKVILIRNYNKARAKRIRYQRYANRSKPT